MEITEVRIKLMESSEDRLRGFCSVTFDDCFVVRDLKIIEGNNGPFVAMPSRKLTSNCHKCRSKNHLRARYCNQCGVRLQQGNVATDAGGRAKLYADIAHPVNAKCREMIQRRVIEELQREFELSQQPGYRSRYDEDYDDDREFLPRDSRHGRRDQAQNVKSQSHRKPNVHPNPSPPAGPPSGSRERESGPSMDSEFGKGILD